ncbi:hypothetical protein LCGC14_0560380 [marine sediment metagenome]|uniref:Uncharacterized protein n=1 Tax=marine sediment metagenome TaxID=412755 RepID=A0A0F9RM64_9ZZZZ
MAIYGKIKETKVSLNQRIIILRVEINADNIIKKAKRKKEKTKSEKHIYKIIKEIFKEYMETGTLHVDY